MVRKSQKNNTVMIVFAMIVVALIIVGAMQSGFLSFNTPAQQEKELEDATSGILTSNYCANNPTKTLKLRVIDDLASSLDYINASTVYIVDDATGSIEEVTITADSDYTSVATDLTCGGAGYTVYLKGATDYSSTGALQITEEELSAETTVIKKEMTSSLFTPFKVYAYDEGEKAAVYDSANSSTYVQTLTSTFYDDTGSTSFAVGAYENLKLTFTIAPNSSNEAFGEGFYIAINSEDETNTDDWNEDTILVQWDGSTLQSVAKTSLPASDQEGLNAYETVYFVETPIGSNGAGGVQAEHEMYFYIGADSVNPDFDPVIRLVPVGDIKSSDEVPAVILENVGFLDDTSKTALYSAQTITLSVS